MELNKIFDLERWEQLQDSLADVTKMAILMVDYKGVPATKHSGCHAFCQKIRQDPKLNGYCQKCDSRGGFEAMKNNSPYIYKCYFSIVDMAIPIIVNNQYVGAIMAGQVRVSEGGENLEKLINPGNPGYVDAKREELKACYEELPVLSYGRITVIANMLYYLCNYMCAETARKQEALSIYETILENDVPEEEPEKKQDPLALEYGAHSEIIKKVFEYIHNNKYVNPSLKQMADDCHVSTGYMSRLFSKEVGESYSVFLTKLKIDWAKALLETTDDSVNEISEKIGYSDAGYFIRVFKKIVGVTPLVYKKYCKMRE